MSHANVHRLSGDHVKALGCRNCKCEEPKTEDVQNVPPRSDAERLLAPADAEGKKYHASGGRWCTVARRCGDSARKIAGGPEDEAPSACGGVHNRITAGSWDV